MRVTKAKKKALYIQTDQPTVEGLYERKTTVWNSGALRPCWDGFISLVRGESTDAYPSDPQNGRDQFARLLNSAIPSRGVVA